MLPRSIEASVTFEVVDSASVCFEWQQQEEKEKSAQRRGVSVKGNWRCEGIVHYMEMRGPDVGLVRFPLHRRYLELQRYEQRVLREKTTAS